jgi:hypothetical protein
MSTFGRRVIDRVTEEVKDFQVDQTLECEDAIIDALQATTATIETLTVPSTYGTYAYFIALTGSKLISSPLITSTSVTGSSGYFSSLTGSTSYSSNLILSSATGAMTVGNTHFDSANNRLYIYNGTNWVSSVLS